MLNTVIAERPLQERLEIALSTNPYVARKPVECLADDGQVTLRGRVSSYFQKQMAQETVRRLDGVEEIQNLLEVCWT